MTNILSQLQEELAEQLTLDNWISGTPPIGVYTEVKGDVASLIKERVAKAGLAIGVLTPKFAAARRENPGEIDVTIMLAVAESVRTNRGPTGTQKQAHAVAVSCVAILDDYQPTSQPYQPLRFRDATVVDGPEQLITWQIVFETTIRVVAETQNDS